MTDPSKHYDEDDAYDCNDLVDVPGVDSDYGVLVEPMSDEDFWAAYEKELPRWKRTLERLAEND